MKARVGRKSLTDASRIRRAGSIQSRLKVSGGITGGATPDPISNSEVKPSRADGTARSSVGESRTPPESSWAPDRKVSGLFLLFGDDRELGRPSVTRRAIRADDLAA